MLLLLLLLPVNPSPEGRAQLQGLPTTAPVSLAAGGAAVAPSLSLSLSISWPREPRAAPPGLQGPNQPQVIARRGAGGRRAGRGSGSSEGHREAGRAELVLQAGAPAGYDLDRPPVHSVDAGGEGEGGARACSARQVRRAVPRGGEPTKMRPLASGISGNRRRQEGGSSSVRTIRARSKLGGRGGALERTADHARRPDACWKRLRERSPNG